MQYIITDFESSFQDSYIMMNFLDNTLLEVVSCFAPNETIGWLLVKLVLSMMLQWALTSLADPEYISVTLV